MDIISRRYECHANNNVGNEVRHQLEWIVKVSNAGLFQPSVFYALDAEIGIQEFIHTHSVMNLSTRSLPNPRVRYRVQHVRQEIHCYVG
jgi:hypothetical protein